VGDRAGDRLVERATQLDERVEKWLEPRRSAGLDRLFYGLSSAADHGMLWHAVGIARAAKRRAPMDAIRFSAALGIESAITNGAIKSCFRRVRPPDHFEHTAPLLYGMRRPVTSSFPSGHAATAFMCASVLAKESRGGSGLIAASRVYVRMHHSSDVIVGAAVGLALGRVARRILT
jgi:undecaprenyl-diphosphatase